MMDTGTGELIEKTLVQEGNVVRGFYIGMIPCEHSSG